MTLGDPRPLCLATVTSDAFALGTVVMIDSFRRSNPWFTGDVVLICDDLSPANRAFLTEWEPKAHWSAPEPRLAEGIDRLVAQYPDLGGRRSRFLSLAAFALMEYRRVLFCDSDVFFTGDFAPLFDRADALIVCPDGPAFRRTDRNAEKDDASDTGPSPPSFNAGMMLIDVPALGTDSYAALLAGLEPQHWKARRTEHTDQYVLNSVFSGVATMVSPAFNLLLGHRQLSFARSGVRVSDARLLHFNGPAKPWDASAMMRAALADAALLHPWRLWHAALTRLIEQRHLGLPGPPT